VGVSPEDGEVWRGGGIGGGGVEEGEEFGGVSDQADAGVLV